MVAYTVAMTVPCNNIPTVSLGYAAMGPNPSQQTELRWHYHSATKKTFSQEESILPANFQQYLFQDSIMAV